MATLSMGSALGNRKAFTHNFRLHCPPWRRPICTSMAETKPDEASDDLRRSGNYQPSPRDYRHLLSVDNKYVEEEKVITRDLLKQKVRKMFDTETNSRLEKLELIDSLHKLGVSYHFEMEINNILTGFHYKNGKDVLKCNTEEDLHATALEFRLLRQHGFNVTEDVFEVIIDKIEGNVMFECDDIKGYISLYEASYLSMRTDTKLQKVIRPFARKQILKIVDEETYESEIREKAIHALEMPYHWRMRRLETRWYIERYEKQPDMNIILTDFAKIDFNITQNAHQEDLKYLWSWWKDTCLATQLPFVRDRIVENYFWTIGLIYEPQHGYIRRVIAKINALVTTIDDIYDIYGTLEELELFTTMVDKWDVNRLDELPEYMKLCFLVLYNEINGIGCDILKNKNIDVIRFLKKSWGDLCNAYLVEAKWYKRGYKPSLEEYMRNGWKSISAPTVVIHFYCIFTDRISIQMLESLSQHRQHVVQCSGTIIRLANDLGTSSDELARGDVLKSVQCYMQETGASEEDARAHVQQMISDMWDRMNYEAKTACSSALLSRGFVEAAMNLARMSQCIYQYGDGHGCPQKAQTVDRVMHLFVNPIPLD